MTKIVNLIDFENITSNITSFSHAYLFNVNSLEVAFPYIKDFAKKIIFENISNEEKELISYQIDHDEFDDLYVVNPSTIGISTSEITKLLDYMETTSLRENGRRVYIIYGFERLTREVSNKILKFLEEPSDNIYALLMTENMDRILSTIISRCQTINLNFSLSDNTIDDENIPNLKKFFEFLLSHKKETIAYENNYFKDALTDRIKFDNYFAILEKMISNSINKMIGGTYEEKYCLNQLNEYDLSLLINFLNITNKLKGLIKQNINLNLLLDRYIIEVTKELEVCKK